MLGTEQRIKGHFMSLPVLIAIIITRRKQELLNLNSLIANFFRSL